MPDSIKPHLPLALHTVCYIYIYIYTLVRNKCTPTLKKSVCVSVAGLRAVRAGCDGGRGLAAVAARDQLHTFAVQGMTPSLYRFRESDFCLLYGSVGHGRFRVAMWMTWVMVEGWTAGGLAGRVQPLESIYGKAVHSLVVHCLMVDVDVCVGRTVRRTRRSSCPCSPTSSSYSKVHPHRPVCALL